MRRTLLRDGETQSESPMTTARRPIRLSKAVEHVRQEISRDALPGVCDANRDTSPSRRSSSVTLPFAGVNFIALPSRFQMTCCTRSASARTTPRHRIDECLDPDMAGCVHESRHAATEIRMVALHGSH
jgi:hypothetical protein